MAPTSHHDLVRRGPPSDSTIFTVSFIIVAGAVLLTCFFFACVWPCLRKSRLIDRSPSRVRSTEGDNLTQRLRNSMLATMFPASRPVSIGYEQQTATELRTYNPHSETPFPNQPHSGGPVNLPGLTPRTPSATQPYSATACHGLLTPLNGQRSIGQNSPFHQTFAKPWCRAGKTQTKSVGSDKEFGDAKDYILALPEPLVLTPRSTDRSPTLARTFPLNSIDNHPHPKKLFQSLNPNNANSDGLGNKAPKSGPDFGIVRSVSGETKDLDDCDSQYVTEEEGTEEEMESKKASDNPSIADMSLPSTADEDECENHNASIAAIHRLKTYRSLTGAKDPRSLTRSGTYTRSKTPVADICSMFDRTASEGRHQVKALPQEDTCSSEPFGRMNSSDKAQSSTTDATSFDFSASSLSLLPTPLRIRAESIGNGIPPVPTVTADQAPLTALPVSREHAAGNIHEALKTKRAVRKPAATSPLSTRSRPIPLELTKSTQPKQRLPQLRGVASAGSMMAPLVRHAASRGNIRSSSIYSRDTKGISFAQTPLSAEFTSMTGRSPISPHYPCTTTSDQTDMTYRKPSSPVDMVKTKVDNWHYPVNENIGFHSPSSTPFSRELDGPGPEIRSSYRASQTTEVASRISTEINADEEACGRMSIPLFNVGRMPSQHLRSLNHHDPEFRTVSTSQIVRQVTSDSALIVAARGHAPGGAQWL